MGPPDSRPSEARRVQTLDAKALCGHAFWPLPILFSYSILLTWVYSEEHGIPRSPELPGPTGEELTTAAKSGQSVGTVSATFRSVITDGLCGHSEPERLNRGSWGRAECLVGPLSRFRPRAAYSRAR